MPCYDNMRHVAVDRVRERRVDDRQDRQEVRRVRRRRYHQAAGAHVADAVLPAPLVAEDNFSEAWG